MKRMRFEAAVRSLSGPELADLIGCMGRNMTENGITGELLGLCLVECVRRLREERGAGRPGNGLAQDAPATLEEGGSNL